MQPPLRNRACPRVVLSLGKRFISPIGTIKKIWEEGLWDA